jgi:hypothetical protein
MVTYSQSRSSSATESIELLVTIQLGETEASASRHEGLGGYPPPKPPAKPKDFGADEDHGKRSASLMFSIPNGSSVTIEAL